MDATPLVRPCPDCGGRVSVRAAACPHCGAPIASAVPAAVQEPASEPVSKSDGSWKVLLLAPLVLCLVLGVLYLAVRPSTGDIEALRRDVARDFRDPSSAEIRNVHWTEGGSACGEVNGANAFGGKTGFQKFYAMKAADGQGYSVVIAGRSDAEDQFLNARCP